MTADQVKNNIKKFLYEKVMKENVCSQADIAKALGISKSAVSKWFSRGSIPNAEYILKICKILKCTPYEMYGEVNPNVLTDEEKHAVELYRNNKDLFKAIENATKKD